MDQDVKTFQDIGSVVKYDVSWNKDESVEHYQPPTEEVEEKMDFAVEIQPVPDLSVKEEPFEQDDTETAPFVTMTQTPIKSEESSTPIKAEISSILIKAENSAPVMEVDNSTPAIKAEMSSTPIEAEMSSFHIKTEESCFSVTVRNKIECKICFRTYGSKTALSRHLAQHRSGKLYICPVCGHSFGRLHNVIRHRATHQLGHKKDVQKHERVHPGRKAPVECKVCGKRLKYQTSLKV